MVEARVDSCTARAANCVTEFTLSRSKMETELAQDKAKWYDFLNRVMKHAFRTHRKSLDQQSNRKLLKQFFVMESVKSCTC